MSPSLAARLVICLMAFAVAALPLILIDQMPFADYPNHLARFHIWQTLDQSEPLSEYYQRRGSLHPYWAFRSVVDALSPLIGLETAARFFVILATLLPAAGICCIGWVLAGRVTLLPLASLTLVHNQAAAFGLHNYLFAAGLALMVFALWIVLRNGPNRWLRIAVMAFLVAVLAVMHLLSVALLALLIAPYELSYILIRRRGAEWSRSATRIVVELALIFAPAALFYLMLDSSALGHTSTDAGGLNQRIIGMLSPFIFFGARDELFLRAFPVALAIIGITLGNFRLQQGAIPIILVLLVVAAFAPFTVSGVALINWRTPFVAVMLIFAFATMAEADRRRSYLFAGAIVIAGIWQLVDTTSRLQTASGDIAELRAAGTSVPTGGRVLTAVGQNQRDYFVMEPAVRRAHYAGYLVVDRDVLFPQLFPFFDIEFKAPYGDIFLGGSVAVPIEFLEKDRAFFAQPRAWPYAYAADWRRLFDHLLVIGSTDPEKPVAGSTLVHKGSYFEIRRIDPPAGADQDQK